jgi:hypothetical protein
MTTNVRRSAAHAWPLGIALILVAAGCGGIGGDGEGNGGSGGPFPQLSPPVSSKPDTNGLVTQIRPQVAKISDSDPLQVVLHWEGTAGPVTHTQSFPVSWFDTCDTLTFHVTAPDGKKHELKPQPQKKRHDFPSDLYRSPTLFCRLTPRGVQLAPMETDVSDWQSGPAPALNRTGTYKVSVTGSLMPGAKGKGKPIPFASPEVAIERGVEGYLPLDEIREIARDKVKRKLDPNHEMGGQVYDDADGNRLVHLTGPSSKLWHFAIHTVQLSPQGTVMDVFSREVSNCLAEGTVLDGETGPVAIEEVRIGQRLWGYDFERRQRVLTTVRAVRRSEAAVTLRLACGLRLTGSHPVYASGRWMPARELTAADELLNASGQRVKVGAIEQVRGPVPVHDVTVDEPHNFFAEGVLVHNKSRGHWPHLDDLWYRLWSPGMK